MSRKHFIALAAALKAAKPTGNYHPAAFEQWRDCVGSVAQVCAETNGQFNRGRFLDACGFAD